MNPAEEIRETPDVPPTEQGPLKHTPGLTDTAGQAVEGYNTAAETIGLIPTLRLKDNLIQTLVIIGCGLVGLLVGWLFIPNLGGPGYIGTAIGGVGGIVVGTLLSGIVLMALGWVRAVKKLK